VWIRGILAERHGLPVAAVRYRTGGLHEPGRVAKLAHDPPPGVQIEPIPAGATLAGMLAAGQIDALYTPRVPRGFGEGRLRRLFADPRGEEERYFAATGIFPIMHVVVLRREVYEQRPWLAQSLQAAFEQARREAAARLAETAAGASLLPWGYADAERTRNVMGTDFWTYGLAGNTETLRTFVRYSFEQGLIKRQLPVAELFAAETREVYVILSGYCVRLGLLECGLGYWDAAWVTGVRLGLLGCGLGYWGAASMPAARSRAVFRSSRAA